MRTPPAAWFVLLLLASPYSATFAQISWLQFPEDLQVVPRDPVTGTGAVVFAGNASSSGLLRIVAERNGTEWSDQVWNVSGAFSESIDIPAERAGYDFSAFFNGSPVGTAENVVSGDVYIVHGQSNATAVMRDGLSANGHQDPFVRTYGVQFVTDGPWVEAEGDKNSVIAENVGSIGQWALRLGESLSNEEGIPIAILNGSRTGKPISHFLRNDAAPTDTGTNYGRLLTRAGNAGVAAGIRAILWYQGESDVIEGTPLSTYASRFAELYADWIDDYPNLEAIYLLQIRKCGSPDPLPLQEWQRQQSAGAGYPPIRVVSTNGLPLYSDACHYTREGHYGIADRLLPLLRRDLYGQLAAADVESPDVSVAGMMDPFTIRLLLTPGQTISVEAGVDGHFQLTGTSASVVSVSADASKSSGVPSLTLTLDGDGSGAEELHYTAHQGAGAGPAIKNATGIGLLSFHKLPVESALLAVDIEEVASEPPPNEPLLLSVAFPNPFSRSAALTVVTARSGHVRAELFDILGRGVRVLFNDHLESGMPKRIDIQGSGLVAGTYYVVAEMDGIRRVRRITFSG